MLGGVTTESSQPLGDLAEPVFREIPTPFLGGGAGVAALTWHLDSFLQTHSPRLFFSRFPTVRVFPWVAQVWVGVWGWVCSCSRFFRFRMSCQASSASESSRSQDRTEGGASDRVSSSAGVALRRPGEALRGGMGAAIEAEVVEDLLSGQM